MDPVLVVRVGKKRKDDDESNKCIGTEKKKVWNMNCLAIDLIQEKQW